MLNELNDDTLKCKNPGYLWHGYIKSQAERIMGISLLKRSIIFKVGHDGSDFELAH